MALLASRRVSDRHYSDGNSDCLVYHAQCSARGAGQSVTDYEPVESALVLPRLAGDACLLRSVDSRCVDAGANHRRSNGDTVCRHEPAGEWLLYLQAKEIRYWYLLLR